MLRGLLLDNLDQPANSSYHKLKLMNAGCVGTLWTAGTHHKRNVYEACEVMLTAPLYMIRIGGHHQPPFEWMADAQDALRELPKQIILENRALLVCGNEPNVEGYINKPQDYIDLYKSVCNLSIPIAAAAPSFGKPDGVSYLSAMRVDFGKKFPLLVANIYAHNVVPLLPLIKSHCNKLYIGEINTLDCTNRVEFLHGAFNAHSTAGVIASLVFIAGGKSNGDWDENYIISTDQARELATMEWKLKFSEVVGSDIAKYGTPTTDIMYDAQGNAWQYSDKGLLFAHKADGWHVYWFINSPKV